MEAKTRRKYDSEFKEEVISMVSNGRPVAEVSASLGIGENLIYKWKSRHNRTKYGGDVSQAPAAVSVSDYERLKARLRETEQERDILKKALGIFSRGI